VLELARDSTRVLGFAPDVLFDGPVDTLVSDHITTELLPTLREALSNIVKHANASGVRVEVAATTASVLLRVTDDGVGLRAGPGGSGMANIRTRAERLGGRCDIRAGDERGTVVEWRVPLSTDR
jgi:signal transduction histidine kinase